MWQTWTAKFSDDDFVHETWNCPYAAMKRLVNQGNGRFATSDNVTLASLAYGKFLSVKPECPIELGASVMRMQGLSEFMIERYERASKLKGTPHA